MRNRAPRTPAIEWILQAVREGNNVVVPRDVIGTLNESKQAALKRVGKSRAERIYRQKLFEPRDLAMGLRAYGQKKLYDAIAPEFPVINPLIKHARIKQTFAFPLEEIEEIYRDFDFEDHQSSIEDYLEDLLLSGALMFDEERGIYKFPTIYTAAIASQDNFEKLIMRSKSKKFTKN